MEKIRINAIDKKPSRDGFELVIVNYNNNKEATLNTKWQSQEVDYLEKDVGIGGEVLVLVVQKGDYTNITKVDMTSAIKREQISYEAQEGGRSINGQEQRSAAEEIGYMRTKMPEQRYRTHKEIIATDLTKIEYRNCPQPKPIDIMESYRWYLKELE